jgi:hypothetical protein
MSGSGDDKKTRSKGSSTDSRGGRGERGDDQADEFVDEPTSQAALDAQQTVEEFDQEAEWDNPFEDEPEGLENYDPDDVEEWEDLDEIEANHGNSMSAKRVGTLEDGTQVVHTDLEHPSITEEDAERQMVGYGWMDQIDPEQTVAHSADLDEGWYANEVAPGVDAIDAQKEGLAEEVDEGTFNEMAATQVILGNTDAHSHNIRVDEDGNLYVFDLDRSAGDIEGDWVGALTQYEDTQDRVLGELEKTANALDIDMDREKVLERARSKAAEFENMDPPRAATEINSEMSETIRGNIQSLASQADSAQADFHYDPTETPAIREGTEFEKFNSMEMTDTAAYAIQNASQSTSQWDEWQQFYDSMTQGELEQTVIKAFDTKIEHEGATMRPTLVEPSEVHPSADDDTPSLGNRAAAQAGGALSRISRDDPDGQRASFERIKNQVSNDAELDVAKQAATFYTSAEVRREIFEEYESDLMESYGSKRFEMQFSDSHDTRASAFIRSYTGSTKKPSTMCARASLGKYGINKETDVSRFNCGAATKPIEPTPEFSGTIERLRHETAGHIREEHGGEITLTREVSGTVTSNATAESWTSADDPPSFGNNRMKARFKPGQVISTHAIEQHLEWGYNAFEDEKEWTVLGGFLARHIPEDSTATSYYDEDNDSTPQVD